MITAGIDLSADPRKTGVATIEWNGDTASVLEVAVGRHSDLELVDLIGNVSKTGIDCPLGWPSLFIDYLIAHRDGGHELVVPETRHPLSYRVTDLHVRTTIGAQPLSVAADRIGAVAMRCAALLAAVTREGGIVDRTGLTGPVVEVYPAGALRIWGLVHQGYKGKDAANVQRRLALVDSIEESLPWLRLGTYVDPCRHADDALDAVLCAVIAGLAQRTPEQIPESMLAAARTEGWIALPPLPAALDEARGMRRSRPTGRRVSHAPEAGHLPTTAPS